MVQRAVVSICSSSSITAGGRWDGGHFRHFGVWGIGDADGFRTGTLQCHTGASCAEPWASCLQASEDGRSQGQLQRDCLQAVMVSLEVPECT